MVASGMERVLCESGQKSEGNFDLNRVLQRARLAHQLVPPMKAAAYIGGGRFELLEKAIPKPLPGEILLEVTRVGICGTDVRIFQGHLQNRVGPRRILGHEAVSIVREPLASGKFRAGDRVAVEPTISCGQCAACRQGFTHVCRNLRILGIDQDGALQQFWAVPENRCHHVPDGISDDQAAMIEPLAVAVHSVRLAALHAGETAVVIGAGTIGLLIAILAQKAGANVTVLEINPYRLELARQFHLRALSPEEPGVLRSLLELTEGAGMNVVFEASGSAEGARSMTSLAAVRGRVILVGIQSGEIPTDLYQIFFRELSVQGVRAYAGRDFAEAIRLLAAGEINLTRIISARYPIDKIQEALETAASSSSVLKILVDVRAA
jgi:2-desacetyl-2-hydroxyethyl bacteriochlorophyllide A dehydrogenase